MQIILNRNPTFKTRLISNRSDLLNVIPLRKNGELPYMYDRLDMYWVNVSVELNNTPITLGDCCIVPYIEDATQFTIEKNHLNCELTKELCDCIHEWFKTTTEYQNQIKWTQHLIETGYESNPYKHLKCPTCNKYFTILGNHKHRKYEGRVYNYHPSESYSSNVDIID